MMWKRPIITSGASGLNFPRRGMSPFSTAHGMGGYWWNAWRGFVPRPSGSKLIGEINEMEENFRHFGAAVIKFWVQIDQEEQLRRFQAREKNPRKKWKLNQEDWRNREKWQPYEEAVNEMFLRTHAPKGPLDNYRRKLQTLCPDQSIGCGDRSD